MKTEQEIRDMIAKVTADNQHILDQKIAEIFINAPVALMQIGTIAMLDSLYFVLGESRPLYKYDERG